MGGRSNGAESGGASGLGSGGESAGASGAGRDGLAVAASEVVAVAAASRSFVITGVATGRLASVPGGHWAVVDPARHPLDVWSGRPTVRRIGRLDAVAVSNGPLMGRRLGGPNGLKVTRAVVAVVPSIAAIITYFVLGRLTRPTRPTRVGIAGVAGVATAISLLARWIPCGRVCSRRLGLQGEGDFDGEGSSHAWFARFGDGGFSSHAIGDGQLPANALAGSGGLIRLIRDHVPVTGGDMARLGGRMSVTAWGLVPHDSDGDGVIVIAGGRSIDVAGIVGIMVEIGAWDAVATDPSGCSLMRAGGRVYVGPPSWHRSAIQRYGLCCG